MATASKAKTKDAKEPEGRASKIPIPEGVVPLTRADVIKKDDRQEQWVEVPEWESDTGARWILLRGLSGNGRDAFEDMIMQGEGANRTEIRVGVRARLVSLCAIDPMDGELLFSPADIQMLGMKNGTALQRLFHVAGNLSGLGKEQREEMVRNLEGTTSDGSRSVSPSPSEKPDASSSTGSVQPS